MRGGRAVKVWDAPTRLFHWALVVLVVASWYSGKHALMQLHFLSGYGILTLLLFRVAWGFVGSETSRFGHFLYSQMAALRHLRHLPRREPDTQIGHNAAGGWMVLLMLALLAVQAGLGLFANDDAVSQGPLADFAGKALSDRLSRLHALNFKAVMALVILHLVALGSYAALKGHFLLPPMLTGRKTLPAGSTAPHMAPAWRALLVLVIAAAAVAAFATGP